MGEALLRGAVLQLLPSGEVIALLAEVTEEGIGVSIVRAQTAQVEVRGVISVPSHPGKLRGEVLSRFHIQRHPHPRELCLQSLCNGSLRQEAHARGVYQPKRTLQ